MRLNDLQMSPSEYGNAIIASLLRCTNILDRSNVRADLPLGSAASLVEESVRIEYQDL